MGSGIGNFDEVYDTILAYNKGVSMALWMLERKYAVNIPTGL